MNAKNLMRATLVLTFTAFAFGGEARAQGGNQNVTITVKPAQSVEERVSDEIKAKELKKAAEERLAVEESARIAQKRPKALLRRARTVYIESGTSFFEPIQLQNELGKSADFDAWQMAIVDGYDKRNVADMIVEVDRPLFTYTFTYKITDRSTGVLLATGKVTAFDSNGAAPKLAKKIIEEIRKARAELTQAKQ